MQRHESELDVLGKKPLMKVLMLGWELPPKITGGLGVACQGLLEGLSLQPDLSLWFVLPRLHGDERVSRARLLAVRDLSPMPSFEEGRNDTSILTDRSQAGSYQQESLRGVFEYADGMDAVMRKVGSVDLIHAHDWLTYPAALQITRLRGCPMIVHVHSTEHERAGDRANPTIKDIERRGLSEADRVFAVSFRTRQILVEKYAVAPEKVEVIHNAADHQPWRSVGETQSTGVVSFIGRVAWQKGPSHFIEAAHKLSHRFPDLRFVMAGEGDRLAMMKAQAMARGIADRVDFPGFLDTVGVQELLMRTAVYVMPSLSEPFGIGALEAVHCGVPVVLSKACGVSELVKHVTQVATGDSTALAEAVAQLLTCPGEAKRQAALAQKDVRGWSWLKAAEEVLATYRSVLEPLAGVQRRTVGIGPLSIS